MLTRNTKAARPLLLLLLLPPRHSAAVRPELLLLLLLLLLLRPRHGKNMGATLMLMRNTTAARPVLLLLLLPRHATAARPVMLLLLRLLPRHAIAARYHTVVPSLASASSAPPVPKTAAVKNSMRVRGFRRRTRHRPLFRNFVGLALGVDGTDGVF